MSITKPIKNRIQRLKKEYDGLKKGKESLLVLIDEAEVAEQVYNSNAIENSTLTLRETERILLELDVSRHASVREVFEAKNLARVVEYIRGKANAGDISKETMLFLHEMMLTNIHDDIAGRFRQTGEFVRVGVHVAPPPENIHTLLDDAISEYGVTIEIYFLEKIAQFHLAFETIHPFIDGNGRIGRVMINYQLQQFGFPNCIIRNKEKNLYYDTFPSYRNGRDTSGLEKILARALMESLHKRIAYLSGKRIIPLTEYVKTQKKTGSSIFNAAKRQTISAFREHGRWKIGV